MGAGPLQEVITSIGLIMFKKIITLRLLLDEMEQDIGISELSDPEKSIFLAAQDIRSEHHYVTTKDLLEHKLTQSLTRPTFFRCLKSIQEKGLIVQSPRKSRGEFEIV